MTAIARAAPPPALPAWERRPDESHEAYGRFLWFTFCRPDPNELPAECINEYRDYEWAKRAALTRYRLEPQPLSPATVYRRMAEDTMITLQKELEYRAAMACAEPGGVTLGELTSLMRVAAELALAQQAESNKEDWDITALPPKDRVEFARMLAIVARANAVAGLVNHPTG